MDDKDYEVAFQLILDAGNSKSNSMLAIKAAKEYDFEKAEELIKEAENALTNAHHTQTDMIQQEAKGIKAEVNIILVHAQDHLTMAMIALDLAKETLDTYKTINDLNNRIRKLEGE